MSTVTKSYALDDHTESTFNLYIVGNKWKQSDALALNIWQLV